MPTGFISIGSNIDKEVHIPSSLKELNKQFNILIISSLYETKPIGFKGDDFYNLVIQFNSSLEAKAIAKILKQIESNHNRTHDSRKYAARTLDLDLIIYGDLIINEGRLQIPRDEIEKYAFVLEPLAEIAPNFLHPIKQKSYVQLWAEYDKTSLKQIVIPSNFGKGLSN